MRPRPLPMFGVHFIICSILVFSSNHAAMAEDSLPLRGNPNSPEAAETKVIALEEGAIFKIDDATVDSGTVAQGGGFRLFGVIGQADAGRAAGGGFLLNGGFSFAPVEVPLFADGFETGNCQRWDTDGGC